MQMEPCTTIIIIRTIQVETFLRVHYRFSFQKLLFESVKLLFYRSYFRQQMPCFSNLFL